MEDVLELAMVHVAIFLELNLREWNRPRYDPVTQ